MRRVALYLGCVLAAGSLPACGASGEGEVESSRGNLAKGPEPEVLAVANVQTENGIWIERKLLTADGGVRTQWLDSDGHELSHAPAALNAALAPALRPALAARLSALGNAQTLPVDISLVPDADGAGQEADSTGSATVDEITVNGKHLSAAEFATDEATRDQLRIARRQRRVAARAAKLKALNARLSLGLSAPELADAADREGLITLRLSAAAIRTVSAVSEVVASVEDHTVGQDTSFASARTSTSTSSADFITGVKGSGVGIYMTESGCAPAGFITNYTLLAGSDTTHSHNVSSILRGVSPDSWVYCRGGAVLPNASDLPGTGGHPAINVLTRSNGAVQTNSAYDSLASSWDDWTYSNRIPIVQSAGNDGAANGWLVSPATGLNLTTVGNYQDHTGVGGNINQIDSQSSYVDPTSKNPKPELSGPGVNIDAGGVTFTGTSQATPFVSAIVADYMSSYTWLKGRAALARSVLIAASMNSVTGGFDKVGYGGINYVSGYWSLGGWWWEGANGAFGSWDAGDITPNNGQIDASFPISSSGARVRVVLSWLNRGTYTLAHLTDAHPIGIDLDLNVTDPSGNSVGASASFDASAEVVSFTAASAGTYSFHLTRYANRDTASDLVIGVAVNADY